MKLTCRDWSEGDTEPGVSLMMTLLDIPKRDFGDAVWFKPLQLAAVSLHTLARRYQRQPDHSSAALGEDLNILAAARLERPEDYPRGKQFRVATPRGAWLGTTEAMDVQGAAPAVTLNCGTFLDQEG